MPHRYNPLPGVGLRMYFTSLLGRSRLSAKSWQSESGARKRRLLSAPLPHFAEGHILGLAAGALPPLFEQGRVVLGNVLLRRDPQSAGGLVDPARWALDLSDVADGGLVDHHMTFSIGPFSTEFLIGKRRLKAEGAHDSFQLLAI